MGRSGNSFSVRTTTNHKKLWKSRFIIASQTHTSWTIRIWDIYHCHRAYTAAAIFSNRTNRLGDYDVTETCNLDFVWKNKFEVFSSFLRVQSKVFVTSSSFNRTTLAFVICYFLFLSQQICDNKTNGDGTRTRWGCWCTSTCVLNMYYPQLFYGILYLGLPWMQMNKCALLFSLSSATWINLWQRQHWPDWQTKEK